MKNNLVDLSFISIIANTSKYLLSNLQDLNFSNIKYLF